MELEDSSEGSMEEEETNIDEEETRSTTSAKSASFNLKNQVLIGSTQNFSIDTLF